MSGATVFELTDQRFKTAENADVMAFVRAHHPSAHSDVGQLLIDLAVVIPGASHYCPSYGNCAYLVLHDATNRIFALAFGMQGVAFRLREAADREEARADGGTALAEIGPEWIGFNPWRVDEPSPVTRRRLARWAARAAVR